MMETTDIKQHKLLNLYLFLPVLLNKDEPSSLPYMHYFLKNIFGHARRDMVCVTRRLTVKDWTQV